jgi:prevent-host-death family protein
MATVNVKEARRKFAQLVESARRGTNTTITRRGRKVAQLAGVPDIKSKGLPDMTAFRASLPRPRKGRTTTIEDLRRTERY